MSFMKGGILFADRITTVSPQYAQEIQTPEFGCGLDGVVSQRAEDLVGLLNGIDNAAWTPVSDEHLPARYSPGNMAGKAVCRAELLKRLGLQPTDTAPIFGMVCRFTEQKGIQLVLANADFFLKNDCRLAILGTGDRRLERAVSDLAAAHPQKIGFAARLDEAMSHLVEAGSDFFLMPSLFEPCGLNQMYSQAYGTIPLVSHVGGLVDTVIDFAKHPSDGTGIAFAPTAAGLRDGLDRALKLYADKKQFADVQLRAMKKDFSWKKAALGYEYMYEHML
jgi:starch synthase